MAESAVENPLPRLILVITFALVFGTGAILSPYLDQTTVWVGVGGACVCWILGVLGWFSTKDRPEHKEPKPEPKWSPEAIRWKKQRDGLRRKLAEMQVEIAGLTSDLETTRVERDSERYQRTEQLRLLFEKSVSEGLTSANPNTTLGWPPPEPPAPKPKTIYDRINEDE